MDITWHGHSCFRIKERGLATVVTDPYDHRIVGYRELDLSADIITISHDDPGHNHIEVVRKRNSPQQVLDGPGEYEIGQVFVTGIKTTREKEAGADQQRNIMYIFDYEGVLVAHLGNLNRVPNQSEVKSIAGDVHVALVPVGGGDGLNASQAVEVIRMLEPSYAVPMYYKTKDSKLDLDPLDNFIKEMGLDQLEPENSLRVTSTRSSTETSVVVLEYEE